MVRRATQPAPRVYRGTGQHAFNDLDLALENSDALFRDMEGYNDLPLLPNPYFEMNVIPEILQTTEYKLVNKMNGTIGTAPSMFLYNGSHVYELTQYPVTAQFRL